MKRLLRLFSVFLAGFLALSLAASPEDQYVRIYDLIQQADSLNDAGRAQDALAKYEEALVSLRKLKSDNPGWNEKVVGYRLNYLQGKVTTLKAKQAPTTAPTPPVQPANQATAPSPAPTTTPGATPAQPAISAETQNQIADLQARLQQMQNDRLLLEAKLREALSVQPAAVDPKELAKAEDKIRSLEKEKDLLQVTLTQEKDKTAKLVAPEKLADVQKALEETNAKLARQTEQATKLLVDQEVMKKQLREEQEKSAKLADPEALKKAQQSLDEANQKLAQQAEAAGALTKEKEVLLKKLQEEQARIHAAAQANPQNPQAALEEARTKLANLTEITDALKQDKEALQKQLEAERARQTGKVDATEHQKALAALEKQLEEARQKAAQSLDPSELRKANDALFELRKQLEEANAGTAALRKERDNAGIEKTELAKALEEANQRLARQKETTGALLKENEDLQKRVKEEQAKTGQMADPEELKKAREQLAENKKKLDEQAAQLAALAKEKEELQASLKKGATDNALVRSLESENISLKKQVVEMRQRSEALAPQVEQSNRQLEQTAKELTALKANYEALKLEKGLLEKRLSNLENAPVKPDPRLIEAEKKLAEAQKAVQATESQVAALQREKEILTTIRGDLEIKLAAAEADAKRLRNMDIERMKKMETDLLAAHAATQERDAKLATAEKERKELESRLAAMISERDQELTKKGKDARKVKEIEKERDQLQKRLNETTRDLYALRNRTANLRLDELNQQLATLRSRVDAYEIKRVPLSPEELALLKAPTTKMASVTPPKPVKELPSQTRKLVAEAQADVGAGNLRQAEQKYAEALKQDNKQVYTLHQMAAVLLDQNKFDEAEKTVNQGLALEADNAGLLYQLGVIRFEQGKLDEAIAVLGRSVKQDSGKPEVFNYLGFVLGKKGMLNEAESAFRKALQLAPQMSMCHMNLAWVYATQKPPFLELARWHYQKGIAGGQPANPELEKLFAAPK